MSETLMTIHTLPNQKILADTVAVPLKKEEILMILECISKIPEMDKKIHELSQKLNNKLKTLETANEIR